MGAEEIVGRGYFPWELPPCFRTTELELFVKAQGGAAALVAKYKPQWTQPARHNLARPAGMRRQLSIPNPLNFISVADAVDRAWPQLLAPLIASAKLSIRRPEPSLGPRAFASKVTNDSDFRAISRSGARILLKADIQNFYPSVYTHSIPWALHTKVVAKANKKSTSLLGNEIDKAIAAGQEGQTMGIPIGCDTSLVLAECILARIEEGLRRRLGTVRGYRFSDDFQLAFRSVSDAESGLGALHEALAEFELSVNSRKSVICDLPDLIESSGVNDLRGWEFRPGLIAQKTDIIGYFDALTEHIVRERGGTIASYGVARLRDQAFLSSSWPLLEGLLLQVLVAEPYSAKQIAMTLSMLVVAGHSVNASELAEAAERMILYHAPLGHGSEVAWAVWLCLAHKAHLSQRAADAIATMNDCFVALLALHARANSLIAGTLSTTLWESLMTEEELDGNCWLLSYEARLKGWLQSKAGGNHVLAKPFFSDLFQSGVSFYDTASLSLSFTPHQFLLVGGGGGGGYGGT